MLVSVSGWVLQKMHSEGTSTWRAQSLVCRRCIQTKGTSTWRAQNLVSLSCSVYKSIRPKQRTMQTASHYLVRSDYTQHTTWSGQSTPETLPGQVRAHLTHYLVRSGHTWHITWSGHTWHTTWSGQSTPDTLPGQVRAHPKQVQMQKAYHL